MIEIWKEVFSHPNYEVSILGNVKNKTTQKILTPNKDKLGYLSITLSKNNKPTRYLLHRLVAITFLPNYYNKPTVNHKNKNPSDCRLINLEWATIKEQNIHKNNYKDKRIINTFSMCNMKPIWRIHLITGEKLEKYNNLTEANEWCIKNNLTKSLSAKVGICATANGNRNKAFGYKWEYENIINNDQDDNEIWSEIPCEFVNGYSKGIEISNNGKIKYKNGNICNGFECGNYLNVSIGGKQYSLHRLVAKTFLPNLENKSFVNHKDGNKLNAKLSNLEWVTESENSIHAYETQLNNNTKPVIQFDIEMKKINEFNSINEASRKLKINPTTIGAVCNLRENNKTAGGFRFMFKEKYDESKDYNSHFIRSNLLKPVIQFDKNMNKIDEFNSISEASKKTNIRDNDISSCCKKKQKTAGGFIFFYKNEYDEKENYKLIYKTKAIKVLQLDKNNNKLNEFNSITEASKKLNISDSNIISCCKGKRKTASGYKFTYA